MKFSASLALAAVLLAGCATTPPPPKPVAADDPRLVAPATDSVAPGSGPIRHAPWFTNVWRDRRTVFLNSITQDQGALVFFGDSITQGWKDLLAPSFPGLKVANRGISGDTTHGLLVRLPDDVLALHPRGLVLLIGTNDLADGAAPELIVANVKLLLASLHAQNPKLPVVLCAVFPSAAKMQRPAARIQELNRQLHVLATATPHVTWLDTWTLFADAQGDAPAELFPDLLHPNAAGYAKWTAVLRPELAKLGFVTK